MVTTLPTGEVYAFGLKASTDGVQWTEISNITVATVALVFDTTPPAPITGLFQFRGGSTSVTVAWPVAGDDGIYGQATSYEARYWDLPITPANSTKSSGSSSRTRRRCSSRSRARPAVPTSRFPYMTPTACASRCPQRRRR